MKKLLLSIALLVSAGTAFGYNLKVRNFTRNEISVKSSFGGPGICGRKNFLVSPGKIKEKGTGICCLKSFKARQTAGPDTKWYSADPGRTGYGISCKSNTFTVRRARDGSLSIER